MCGIFAYFSDKRIEKQTILKNALKIAHRGEDETHMTCGTCRDYHYNLVFHRLAINGMSQESAQPLTYSDKNKEPYIYLMANAEIYNHRELANKYGIECHGSSDCEIIIHLYMKLGFSQTLKLLDGVFAIVLLDLRGGKVYMGRDPLGVRGMCYSQDSNGLGICSEMKGLTDLLSDSVVSKGINEFPPSCWACFNFNDNTLTIDRYRIVGSHTQVLSLDTTEGHLNNLTKLFDEAIHKRLMCDRKTKTGFVSIGAYLSGGFDSSAVAALTKKYIPSLKTFSIGFKDSPDLLKARIVAKHIGSEHHEYVVSKAEMLDIIPDVVRQVETYDTTTIRASAFMYKLTQFIYRDFPDIAVLLSGEGSDEASGSYMYFHNAPGKEQFHMETVRLLRELHYFDARRADRSSAAFNKEIRVPFLDLEFLDYYVNHVPVELKMHQGIEKWILRKMIERLDILPDEIVWRPKEAMSDGVSDHSDSWSTIIQNHLKSTIYSKKNLIVMPDVERHSGFPVTKEGYPDINRPISDIALEKQWYMSLFLTYYPGCQHVIPYYWEPKWCQSEDPSARLLTTYRK